MSAEDRSVAALIRASKALLDARGADGSLASEPEEVAQVFRRARAARGRRHLRRLAGGTALLVLLAAGGAWRLLQEDRLTYAIEGGTLEGGVRARGGSRLRFSDGTSMVFASGARGRVADLNGRGARVVLDEGRARVQVVKRKGARWTVHAGPYTIVVTGTAFDVSWETGKERLDVAMEEGRVVVTGPLAQHGLTLEAGQRLTAQPRAGQVLVASTAPATAAANTVVATVPAAAAPAEPPAARVAPASAPAAAPAPPPVVVSPAGRRNLVAPADARAASSPPPPAELAPAPQDVRADEAVAWTRLIAAGDFEAVLAGAERLGFATVIDGGSAGELNALADAARYARRASLAERALLALRRRFPGASEAIDAWFLLGRLAETNGPPERAVGFYDQYLEAAPAGAYAGEALGRKLVIVHRRDGAAMAAPLARQYLERFAGGAYAGVASRILEGAR